MWTPSTKGANLSLTSRFKQACGEHQADSTVQTPFLLSLISPEEFQVDKYVYLAPVPENTQKLQAVDTSYCDMNLDVKARHMPYLSYNEPCAPWILPIRQRTFPGIYVE